MLQSKGAQSSDILFPYLELWQNLIRRSQAYLGLNSQTQEEGDTFSFEAVLHPEWILANFPVYLRGRLCITKYYIKGNGRTDWLYTN